MREQIYLRLFGAGDRDRTGDIQLGKVYIAFIINNLQRLQSAKIDASGFKGILTAGAKEGFHPMNMRVSACSFVTPFSTPLEHRKAVRTSGGTLASGLADCPPATDSRPCLRALMERLGRHFELPWGTARTAVQMPRTMAGGRTGNRNSKARIAPGSLRVV